jgi:hypothetical protein
MTKRSKAFRAAALAVVMLGLAACASQKEPAEAALAAVEAKFKETGAEVQKYLPERYAEVEAGLASLREAVAGQKYGDVVTGAEKVTDDLKRAVAEARIKRAQILVEMESEWTELSKSMPEMIAAMDKKISAQRGRPPQGMTADAWKQTIADYDAARDAWSKAASEITSQTFEATVLAARDAKAKIAAIMDSVGVKSS